MGFLSGTYDANSIKVTYTSFFVQSGVTKMTGGRINLITVT